MITDKKSMSFHRKKNLMNDSYRIWTYVYAMKKRRPNH
jgi:hypothetical protein